MVDRGPNCSQKWKCTKCGEHTVHEISDTNSHWDYREIPSGNMFPKTFNMYVRRRKCKKCYSHVSTVELEKEKLEEILRQLEELKKSRNNT